jgi:GTPase Era involved in 16S rRNA processing
VLIIGNTGAGKSTLINYQLGYKMVKSELHGSDVYNTEGNIGAVIGHSKSISETLFSETFENKLDNIVYCDCPGFGENRDVEIRICVYVLREIIIRQFSSIKSIIIVISMPELESSRGAVFKELCENLGDLLKNPNELKASLIFVLTKVPKGDDDKRIHARLSKMLSDELSLFN